MLTLDDSATASRVATSPAETAGRRWLVLAALILLATVVIARTLAPSDLWDQTQPRTIAYTADMLVHGGSALLLPRDGADLAATKPPLYNWLALPGVAIAGRDNDFAHRLPSLLALIATLLVTMGLGERLRLGAGVAAACMLLASYPIFKLGLLARPDMLLVLWLLCGWWAATALIAGGTAPRGPFDAKRERIGLRRGVFWTSFVLAAWTKGPAALLLPLHALLLARLVGGSWRQFARVGLGWSPLAALLALAWPLTVLLIEPRHLVDQLWGREVVARVVGAGPEGNGRGLLGIATGALDMPGYLMVRFLPWSLPALAGSIAVIGARRRGGIERSGNERLLESAVLWIVLVTLFFTLSSGKRADYIAPAYPMAALLAGWWLCDAMRLARRPLLLVMPAYVAMAAVCIGWARSRPAPPEILETIETIERLGRGERAVIESMAPGELLLIRGTPAEHLAALVGSGRPRDSSPAGVLEALAAGRTVRLVHEPMHATPALRSLLQEAEIEGRSRLLWRVAVPWPHFTGLAVECVEVRSVRGVAESAGEPTGRGMD